MREPTLSRPMGWVVLASDFRVRLESKGGYTMDIETIIYGWLLASRSMNSCVPPRASSSVCRLSLPHRICVRPVISTEYMRTARKRRYWRNPARAIGMNDRGTACLSPRGWFSVDPVIARKGQGKLYSTIIIDNNITQVFTRLYHTCMK